MEVMPIQSLDSDGLGVRSKYCGINIKNVVAAKRVVEAGKDDREGMIRVNCKAEKRSTPYPVKIPAQKAVHSKRNATGWEVKSLV
jgi:hypothetical protein